MNTNDSLIYPKLPLEIKNKKLKTLIILVLVFFIFLPWVAFTIGRGKVTAINPNERLQTLTAPVSGFIKYWAAKEGEQIREGEIIAEMVDSDPQIIERLQSEVEVQKAGFQSAKLMTETSELNLKRQQKLFEQGLSSRKEFEKAKIEFSKMEMEFAKARTQLIKAETQLSRQSTQVIRAPRDGIMTRILPGEMGLFIKAGTPIGIFTPKILSPAVEVWIDGNDSSLVLPGQKARIQIEGWPAIQIPGWPSVSIGTFKAKVHFVDQASSYDGKFRVLLVPDGAWPSEIFLRLGLNVKAYIQFSNTFILKEIWRQLNAFPPFNGPMKDELNRLLKINKDQASDDNEKDGSKDEK